MYFLCTTYCPLRLEGSISLIFRLVEVLVTHCVILCYLLTQLRPEGGVNGTFLVFAYLIIATGDEQKEKNWIKI